MSGTPGAVYLASSATGHVTRRSPHGAHLPRPPRPIGIGSPNKLVRSEPATGKADEDKIGSARRQCRISFGIPALKTGEAEAGK